MMDGSPMSNGATTLAVRGDNVTESKTSSIMVPVLAKDEKKSGH